MLFKKYRQKIFNAKDSSSGVLQTEEMLVLSMKGVPSVSPFHWLRIRSAERRIRTVGVAEIIEAPVIRGRLG